MPPLRDGLRALLSPPDPKRKLLVFSALGLVALLLGSLLAWSFASVPGGALGAREVEPVTTMPLIHVAAVDPSNPAQIFLGTERGLVRGMEGGDGSWSWAFLGPFRNDFLALAFDPEGGGERLFMSGRHQSGVENLGVRVSKDGGFGFSRLALKDVAVYDLTVSAADPRVMVAHEHGRIHRSGDGGHEWGVVNRSLPGVRALATHGAIPNVVYAASEVGLLVSGNGGASWAVAREGSFLAVATTAADPLRLYAATAEALHVSADGGATWSEAALPQNAADVALAADPQEAENVYAVLDGAAVLRSGDGGGTWSRVHG